ncbi:hypothetical protein B5X24_HaOG204807 [Helicoverpa armigera]|uniref:Reverse transcriptase domain-containing protein n=1 Tax=Helicoverpa armigera TaxID=29058 RepID=A0A2W1BRQ7_HELAM|nr:hypothetical protein B5X24_HaOG204807 [Helicoverpa armigera]
MQDKYFKVGLLNVGSLGTKHDDFVASVVSHSFDIVAVNETWLRAGEEGRAPTVPGYRLRHTPRPATVRGGRGGGVGFYIKRGLTVRACSTPTDPRYESIEQMWITLCLNGVKLAIGTAYRPPRSDLDLFLDAITESISSLAKCDHYVLLGDFNVNMLNTSYQTRKVCEFLNSLDLKQLVDSPTHFTDHSQTLIDLVCTSINNTSVCVEPFGAIHGHALVICTLNIKRSKYKPHTVVFRPISKIDRESFDDCLAHINWEIIRVLPNVNDMVDALNRIVVSVFDEYAPVKTCLIKDHSYPWITDTIKFMMHLRNEALAKYRTTKSESKKLSQYLEDNSILPELQSGFRKQRGTSTALLDVTDNILSAQDKGMCTILVLLDFSRAFDCINIELLLCKLKYYGFDDNAIKWFRSYLSNRQQRVEVRLSNGSTLTSSLTPVNRGVPQGSILGPLIFILYCADIVNSLKRCRYHIYADDVQVYVSFVPSEYLNALGDLNEDLNRIASWAEVNGLVLNPTKTKYMIFGTKFQISALPSTMHVVLMGFRS